MLGGDYVAPPETADGDRKAKLTPLDNVYSYFMFVSPIEQKKSPGKASWNYTLASMLVLINIVLQGILLYAIFNQVVTKDSTWRGSIVKHPSIEMNQPSFDKNGKFDFAAAEEAGACNTGESLCVRSGNGTFTCAPPSVQLTGRWDELDTNGDGIWARDEVEASAKVLQCKYAVDPIEVFNVFKEFLLMREEKIWLHPDLRSGKAIHKAYFTYAAGDIAMCGYRNEAMCPNLFQRGVFDAPLRDDVSPRVGNTINSALDYCHDLLKPGGICERTLPSAYSTWQITSADQCLNEVYNKFTYTHPKTDITKSMLAVDYKARKAYKKEDDTYLFLCFKSVILGAFMLAMWVEFKDICIVLTWCIKYPDAAEFGEDAVKEERGKYTIQGISSKHRTICLLLNIVRLAMVCVLAWVGLAFLLKDTDYINLLLNGVGLVFVIELANALYAQVLSSELREACENAEPMTVPMYGSRYLNNRPALKDTVGFVCLTAFICLVMYAYSTHVVDPLSQALECTCLSQGDNCFEAQRFDHAYWENYWTHDIPDVYTQVASLKDAVEKKETLANIGTNDHVEVPDAVEKRETLANIGTNDHVEVPVSSVDLAIRGVAEDSMATVHHARARHHRPRLLNKPPPH